MVTMMELSILMLGSTSLLTLILLVLTMMLSKKQSPKRVPRKVKSDLRKIKEQINGKH